MHVGGHEAGAGAQAGVGQAFPGSRELAVWQDGR